MRPLQASPVGCATGSALGSGTTCESPVTIRNARIAGPIRTPANLMTISVPHTRRSENFPSFRLARPSAEDEFRGLRTGEEAERHERRAEPGRHVQHRLPTSVDALRVAPAPMREPDLPPAIGDRDLAVVQVACERELVHAGPHAVEDVRVVAEQDAEVRGGVRSALGIRAARAVSDGIDPHDLHAPALQLELDRLVAKQVSRREVLQPARGGKWVAGLAEVVVAEHGVRAGAEALKQVTELRLPTRVSEQVARHKDEVGLPLLDPRHGSLDRPRAARGDAEVEVREMRDPQAVELGGQPWKLHVERPEAHPTGLEPPPAEQCRGGGAQAADDAREHHETLEMARARPRPGPKPPLQRARCRQGTRLAAWPSDRELVQDRLHRDDVPPELQLGVLEAGRDPDQLCEV